MRRFAVFRDPTPPVVARRGGLDPYTNSRQ
jgi:hypothetical protein